MPRNLDTLRHGISSIKFDKGFGLLMSHASVSIVIPNYNGETLLPRTLPKVYDAFQCYPGGGEIIVVDDASQDGSVPFIRGNFPGVKVFCHHENKGFSEAVMTGVMNSSHEIIILLNTDVLPDKHFIKPLMKWFDLDDTFSVSPLLCDFKWNPSGGGSWTRFRIAWGNIRSEKWDKQSLLQAQKEGRPLMSLFASGGSMAFRKHMFLELQGFLSIYKPFYCEDRDLGTRAWQQGWKTYCEPNSKVIHDHSGVSTIKRHFSSWKINSISSRNRFIYLWLHLSPWTLVLSHIPCLIPRLLGRLIRFDLTFMLGFFRAIPFIGRIFRIRSDRRKGGSTLYLGELSTIINQGAGRKHKRY